MDSPLNEKLKNVKWGEFKLGDLFEILTYKKRFDANKVELVENCGHPYVVRTSSGNGQKGFIDEDEIYLNDGNTISFGQDTATMYYQEVPYFTGDKIKILKSKLSRFGKTNAQFFLATMRNSFQNFTWGSSSFNVSIIANQKVQLPLKEKSLDFSNPCDNIKNINFDFMESFIRELEEERIRELNAYLLATELKDYALSDEEEKALEAFKTVQWGEFNLENLYGKSTRGKRLKGEDRIKGELPFVTAGEAETGISAYISNDVEIFSKNTTTIDMFGSAKYRNYNYGADDHVAVVHTEELPKHASIFVTSAIHKSSHTGKFDYSNNFYASDADELNIQLPTKNNKPDYATMETFIKAVEKLVIKDVVQYTDKRIAATAKLVK
ncbi:MAG: restriction endonuclease subunit S [Paludibacteraceae bacterium]